MVPSQASVVPLSIEVKAIRIDGRKMTIAVFQQLREIGGVLNYQDENPCIRRDLKPWGYVRYKVKDEGDLWLLAEWKGELCRAPLMPGAFGPFSRAADLLSAFRKQILENHEQLFIAT